MSEGDCSVVRIVLFYQYMAVEASHFLDGKNADAAEALCSYRQNFSLGNVSAQLAVRSALQAVECNIARDNIAFQGSLCRLLAMIIWYFMVQAVSLLEAVFPQWNPMKVSFCV